MAFIINGVAFPERVTDFSITKVEDKYKAVVEWKNRTVHPEMMDKMIKFSVTDLTEEDKLPQPEDASIFWRQIMQETNAKVEFKLK
jgi:beta-mannanase